MNTETDSDDRLLRAAQEKLMARRKLLGIEQSSIRPSTISLPNLRRTHCLICQTALTSDRFAYCERCEAKFEATLQARIGRDEEESIAGALLRSCLPPAYRLGTRGAGDVPKEFTLVRLAMRKVGAGVPGIFLSGAPRTYKTTLACSFLAHKIRTSKGKKAGLFVSTLDLMTDIMASYKRQAKDDDVTRASLVDMCVNAPILVLDDFGKEKASEHAAGVIFEILDGRFRRQRPDRALIITSNFTYSDLTGRFDAPAQMVEAIEHRLSQLTVYVRMEGSDDRAK